MKLYYMSLQSPEYFKVNKSYNTIPIGHINSSHVIVNSPDYDFFVLAGIPTNEVFSHLVMKNMNIRQGVAFDTNVQNISSIFPHSVRIVTKNVRAITTPQSDNMFEVIKRYKDIFLKMDIDGEEYLWVLSLTHKGLSHFKQMVISFNNVNDNPTKARAINKINCFKKLLVTHDIAHIKFHQSKLIITYIRKEVQPTEYDGNNASNANESDSNSDVVREPEPEPELEQVIDIIPESVVETTVESIAQTNSNET